MVNRDVMGHHLIQRQIRISDNPGTHARLLSNEPIVAAVLPDGNVVVAVLLLLSHQSIVVGNDSFEFDRVAVLQGEVIRIRETFFEQDRNGFDENEWWMYENNPVA